MSRRRDEREAAFRGRTSKLFRYVEDAFYVAVAVALGLSGILLFGNAIYAFITSLGKESLSGSLLGLLDGMLLVFIVTELIHTIAAVVRENVLLTEPFLIVGIVAAIRRLIVISAEAKNLVGTPDFQDAMVELAVLTAAVVALALAIFLLRHTAHSEPRPSYERERESRE